MPKVAPWLRSFERLFINRSRPYAVQERDGSYRWAYQRCTPALLESHLHGEITLAVSSLDASGLCKWLCLDADAPDGLAKLLQIRAGFDGLGWPSMLEASRRGGHLWFMLGELASAQLARTAILGALERLRSQDVPMTRLEVYPDRVNGLGHAVRLPLGIHRKSGQRYPLLDGRGQPLAFTSHEAAVSFLLAQPHLPVQWLKATWAPTPEPRPSSVRRMGSLARSPVIRWVETHANLLDLVDDLAPETALRASGRGYIGWCPFHDDAAPQEDGSAGTPSFYVADHPKYGWSWRCLSSNCRYQDLPVNHAFDLFCALKGMDHRAGIAAAQQYWPETRSS